MKKLRVLLLPLSWVYGLIMAIRNWCYDTGILSSYEIPVKSICIGNLSTGGTGKSPHVEYLIRHFLNQGKNIAVLSRGYGRITKGVLEVETSLGADHTGDEPLQFKHKFGDKIRCVVAEKRKEGVEYILRNHVDIDLILLDDAFQHRAVKAGLSILITPFDDLFINDFVLPAGNLREWKSGKKRADTIIVSKCPEELSIENQSNISSQLEFASEKVFFSTLQYSQLKPINDADKTDIKNVLLVTGIGNPKPLKEHLTSLYEVEHMQYPDHHAFSHRDIQEIREKFDTFANRDKIIVTTEKDYMRLLKITPSPFEGGRWYYQPIRVAIKNEDKLNDLIDNYAE